MKDLIVKYGKSIGLDVFTMADSKTGAIEPGLIQAEKQAENQVDSIASHDPSLPQLPELPPSLNQELDTASFNKPKFLQQLTWKRVRGGLLFIVGWLLSPLCWWNDLIFNLPVAYGFGYLCHLFSAKFFIPGLITGYWISNVIGILLMQFGAIDVVQKQTQDRNLTKDLWTGVVSSTVYTGIIVALLQFHIIDMPALFAEEARINLGAFLPIALPGQ